MRRAGEEPRVGSVCSQRLLIAFLVVGQDDDTDGFPYKNVTILHFQLSEMCQRWQKVTCLIPPYRDSFTSDRFLNQHHGGNDHSES